MGRLPTTADFSANVKVNIVPPVNNDPPTNILILLHGLGDTHASFTHLAAQLRLPETACLAVQAPLPLLDLGGFHWGDDIVFDSSNGGLDADAGFAASTAFLRALIRDALLARCGFAPRDVLLFGFGQGGMAALNIVAVDDDDDDDHNDDRNDDPDDDSGKATKGKGKGKSAAKTGEMLLGGVVSIGAPLAGAAPGECAPKRRTPVLVCAGAADASTVTPGAEDKLKRVFEFVELVRYRRPGDGMPKDRGEMLPIMQFFARRLRSVKGVPAGSVELA